MKGRFFLVGLILLLLFTVAVTQTAPSRNDNGNDPLFSVDIVVVGSGIPALTAALEATRLGAEVLLLDNAALRDEFPFPMGGRFVAFEAAENPEGEERAGELRLLESIRHASPGIEETLLEDMLRAGRETLAWLTLETGLSFQFDREHPFHVYDAVFSEPDTLAEALRTALLPRLAVMIPDGEPLEILVSLTGMVEGLRFMDHRGKANTVMAPSVILATGGYVGNSEFLQTYNPAVASLSFSGRETGTGGDAFNLTKPLRARVTNGERVLVSPVLHPQRMGIMSMHYPLFGGGSWFDVAGRDVTSFVTQAMAAGENRLREFLEGEEVIFLLFADGQQDSLPGLHRIGSIVELSEYTAIPLEQCEEISRRLSLPYGLGRLDLELFYSMGGLDTDDKGQVLGPLRAISGLYALGEATGILHGQGIYPGLPLTEALVLGRRVGREAALFSRR